MTTTAISFAGSNGQSLTAYDSELEDFGRTTSSGWEIITDGPNAYAVMDGNPSGAARYWRCGITTAYNTGSNDHYAQFTVQDTSAATANFQLGVMARMVAGSSTVEGYLWQWEKNSAELQLRKAYSTYRVDIGSPVSYTLADGDVMRIEVEGTEIRGYINGTLKATVTNSTFTTGEVGGGYCWANSNDREIMIDTFEQGPLSAESGSGSAITTRAKLEVILDGFCPAYKSGTWTYAGTPQFKTTDHNAYIGYSTFGTDQGMNIAPDITKLSISRGRSNELQPFRAGTLSFEFNDNAEGDVEARHWDPDNEWTTAAKRSSFRKNAATYPNNYLGETVTVYALVDNQNLQGVDRIPIFKGTIETYEELYQNKNRHSGKITASDGIAKLSQLALPADVMRNGGNGIWQDAFEYDQTGHSSGEDYVWYSATGLDITPDVGDIVWCPGNSGESTPTLYSTLTPYYIIEKPTSDSMRLSANRGGEVIAGIGDNTSENWDFTFAYTPPTFSAEMSGQRIVNILDCTSLETQEQVWPGSGSFADEYRDIDPGTYEMQAKETTGNVWAELSKVGESELNNGVFVTKAGKLRFRALYSSRVNSGLVFSDDGAGDDIKYIGVKVPYSKKLVYNLFSFFRHDVDGVLGNVPESAEDADSQAVFGIREYSRKDLLLGTDSPGDTTTQNQAEFLRDEYADPTATPPVKEMRVTIQDKINSVKTKLFGVDLLHEVNIELGTRGGLSTLDADFVVDRIAYSFTPGGAWDMTLGVSKAWVIPGAPGALGDNRVDYGTVNDAKVGI